MAIYSHSKLSTFEQCKYQYKLKYIDRIKVEIPTTIEMFMGSCVHKALELLYRNLKYQKVMNVDDLIRVFRDEWEKEWSDDILIVKDFPKENYLKMGEKFLRDYYKEYSPFGQLTTIGLETEERLKLEDGSFYHVRIDRLAANHGTYYVCDYKTNAKMKLQQEADRDRQLAMYSIWVHNHFKDAQRVVLVWHMLAFNKEVTSERSRTELRQLEKETIALIKEIESTSDFPTSVSALCDYCVYKHICPSFAHEAKLSELTAKEYHKDSGVLLVNKYSELKEKEGQIWEELNNTKEELVAFAKNQKVDVIYGSSKKAMVKEYEKVVIPEGNKDKVEELIKKKGLYEQLSLVSWAKLNAKILDGDMDKEIVNLTKREKDFRVSLSKKKENEEED